MVRFVTLAAACILGVLLWFSPRPDAMSHSFEPPPREEVLLFASGGDRRVAADIGWVLIVQRIGSGSYLKDGAPALEEWADVTTTLDPQFEAAYFVAATFLTALPDRVDSVDALLAKGERELPASSMLPMARGLVHYFGRFEPEKAAASFRLALARGAAPPYLQSLADRLERFASSCKSMGTDLAAIQNSAGGARNNQARDVAMECSRRIIERAAAAARLRGEQATVESLTVAGELGGVVQFPGECWNLVGGKALLEPCP